MTTESSPRRARRRLPALASRVAATGLSTAFMLGIIGGLTLEEGRADPTEAQRARAEVPRPRQTIIVRVVRRRAQPIAPTRVVRRIVRRPAAPQRSAPAAPPDTSTGGS